MHEIKSKEKSMHKNYNICSLSTKVLVFAKRNQRKLEEEDEECKKKRK